MPPNALNKLVRDVGTWENEVQIGNKSGFGWNRAVVIIGISDQLRDGNGEEITISEFIEGTQMEIIGLSEANDWDQRGLSMTLTGPVPVSYTHLRAHETRHDLVCRLLLEKKKNKL